MIEDMTHLGVLDALAREIDEINRLYNSRANGQTEKTQLLATRIEHHEVLREVLRKQLRHLRFMNGDKIEPETHQVEAALVGFGGVSVN